MKYFDIIPLTKVARNKPQFFTYSHNQELEIGTLLEINFGRKKIQGIVAKKVTQPTFETRAISKVISSGFLTPKQIQLAKQISTYYLTSLGTTIKQFVPKFAKKETACYISPENNAIFPQKKTASLTSAQTKVVNRINAAKTVKPFLLFGPASAGKTEVIMHAMQETLAQKKQCLLIIPEILLSSQEIARYKQRFIKQNILFFHSKLKSTETTFALNRIKDGSADIIISTRVGLFLPFKDLGLIALDEEQDISHKQWDQSPRYHARTVAEMLTKLYQTKTLFVSSTPSLESLQKAWKRKYRLLELPRLKTADFTLKKPEFLLANLQKVYDRQNKIPFSPELKTALQETLAQKKLSLILVPRRGKSKLIYCSDCKQKLRCPNCELPLVHQKDHYRCLHCAFKTSNLTQCPACRSFRLKDIGFGTEGVTNFLKKTYPTAKIALIDSATLEKLKDRKRLFNQLLTNKIDILVGTYTIAKGLDLANVELVATINADNWAGQIDFRFDERWLGNLFQLAGRLNRVGSGQTGRCIIQTYNPENELLETLQQLDWLTFAQEELLTRESFLYPPFSFVIRLTLKQANKLTLAKKAKKLHNELLKKFHNSQTLVQAPYFGTVQKVRGRWEKHVLLKTTSFTSETWKGIARTVPDEWIIDVDSETIF